MADHSYATMQGSYSPLDRAYSDPLWRDAQTDTKLATPIIPFKSLGQTVPENDPRTGAHILQNVQAAIRSGVGNIQIVMSVGSGQAMGGSFKAYGPESREQLRHMFEESGTALAGVELPTSTMSNLTGLDRQQGRFSDEQLQRDLEEVRDAIKFVGEVGKGGGIDVLSWEFDRGIGTASWNKELKDGTKLFGFPGKDASEQEAKETIMLVDKESGRVMPFKMSETVFLPFDPKTLDPRKPETQWQETAIQANGLPKLEPWTWKEFTQVAKNANMDPVTLYLKIRDHGQIETLEGYASYYNSQAKRAESQLQALRQEMDAAVESGDRDRAEQLKQVVAQESEEVRRMRKLALGQLEQAEQHKHQRANLTPIGDFALKRAEGSYAELGIAAMQETHNRDLPNPLHVGPEMGWPQFYGSHPKEFVDLILNSRKEMAARLIKEGIPEETARDEARKHIKGELDTSHLGMFFEHFMPNEKDKDTRLKAFNKWFIEQVEFIADVNKKEDILGGVQIVNSMSGAHAHLPPSQGIFPVIEAARILKEKGNFNGPMTSEGHEEEKFGPGRIIFDSWANLAGNIMSPSYVAGRSPSGGVWMNPQSSYFGRAYAPTQMFGEYAPNQEFRLWSDVPLE